MFVTELVVDAKEEKHIAAVLKAMEERGMLDHTIVHGVFVGPARSGKNSLMERLLGRMPSSVSPSTGVAESVVQVKVIQKSATFAANVKKSIWSVMDYDDEAIKLMLINSDSKGKIEVPVLQLEELNTNDPQVTSEGLDLNSKGDTDIISTEIDNSEPVSSQSESRAQSSLCGVQLNSLIDQPSSIQPRPRLPDSYIPPIEIVKMALRKKGKKGLEILQQHFQRTWSLYLTNTGGQMEFQEVLPLLVSGPSMFFFTFRLDRDLNEHYVIEYDLSDGTKAHPYTSTLTMLEGLLQTLATIAAMGTFVYKGLQRSKAPLKPKVFIVGTHKDQLDSKTADKHIYAIDQQIQEAIKSTSHYKDLVEFFSPSQLIFTVSNFSESESDFKDIRSAVERVVGRNEFQMTSPVHWLIFSLALRKLKPYVVSYDLCLEIARQCGLADDELDEALHFIHSKMGLIRYFPYEDVKDLVIIHPQFLFDKVTELIVDTFTFEKASKHVMDEFKKKGIFSLSEFETISSRTNASITPFQFSKLLERLRIAAPFEMDGNRMYFFPCVLAHTAIEILTPPRPLSLVHVISKILSPVKALVAHTPLTSVPNLMVTFECGYCPKGLAGALIKYLMANEMKSSFSWELYHDKIFRNQVSFKVGPLDTVVLKILSTHLEIIFAPEMFQNRDKTCPEGEVCSSVCKAVDAGIRQVTLDINYVNGQHSLTFPCGCKGDHPGQLEFVDDVPFCLTCEKRRKRYPLPTGHELWQIDKLTKSECTCKPAEHNSMRAEAQSQSGETINNGEGRLRQ